MKNNDSIESHWTSIYFVAPVRMLGFAALVLCLTALCVSTRGAAGDVDLSFDPGFGINQTVNSVAFQPDGKILIGGVFTTIKSFERPYLARINADGSGDTTFNAGHQPTNVYALILQPDGKVLVGDENGIKRFNPDGNLDTNFACNTGDDPAYRRVRIISLQPDGKAIIAGSFFVEDGTNTYRGLARLNSNGSFDLTFNPIWDTSLSIYAIILQPDGRVLLGGTFGLWRLNVNGSYDNTFTPANQNYYVTAMARQPDGKLLVAYSRFDAGTNNLVRLEASGSVDPAFHASTDSGFIESIAVQSDGKVLIEGPFNVVNGAAHVAVARLLADGSLDNGFNISLGFFASMNSVFLQPDAKILAGGFFSRVTGTSDRLVRLNSDGSLDATFDAGRSVEPGVSTLSLQPDGKLLIGDRFTFINGTNRYGRARLNPDGTFDTGFVFRVFQPQFSFPQPVYSVVGSLAVQPDGRVLVSGTHDYVTCGEEGCGIAQTIFLDRVFADGRLDTNFQTTNIVVGGGIALQADGKILVGNSAGLKRLHANGTVDNSFNSTVAGSVIAVQPDGKILMGTWTNWIVRLNATGALDNSFTPAIAAGGSINVVALQTDGKVLVGGNFTSINGTSRGRLARLHANGILDESFSPHVEVSYPSFPSPGAAVSSIAAQPDGQILIGGAFTHVNGVARLYVARLFGDSPLPSLGIARSNNVTNISWPVTALHLRLQENTNIATLNGWSLVAQPVVTNGGNVSVSVPTSGSQKFFRLSSQ